MNRINALFAGDNQRILSIYFCAGAPTVEGTRSVIEILQTIKLNLLK